MDRFQFSETEQALIEKSRAPMAVYQFVDNRVVTIARSKGFCDLFGYEDLAEAYYDMDNDMYKRTHIDDSARIADAAFRFATEGGDYDVIYRTTRKKDDKYYIVHAQGEHIFTDSGVRLAQVWYTNEGAYAEEADQNDLGLTNSLKNALFESSLLKASHYDHLTGLPSMTYFFELATTKKERIAAEGGSPSMLFMDFSGMKYFNHKYGFAEGDKLLQAFSRILAESFGNENCSRFGQDHFAVITKAEGIEPVLREIFEKCKTMNDGLSLPLHVGIYSAWYDGIIASMACDRAKFACDTLSSVYASDFSYYNMSMKDAEEKQQYIIANLDKAIQERWIKVYYQPIVRAVNGRVCDEEALARWIDPVRGFMSPADFIPILEEHRLIYKLDLFILECVLIKTKTLSEAGLHTMPQSINLSRSDFDTCDIVEEVRRRVDAAGVDHKLITIEITESIIGQDFEFMKAQIDRFREQGFAVWMDDFGSGYSSLDVLQSVDFDLIKFDMRFMQNLGDGNRGRIILTELLKMATSLGIDTICEGVETEEQVQFLQDTGCSKLQGYYFQKPIPVEKILEKYAKGIQIGFEDPVESQYFEAVGRVNLHDLSIVAKDEMEGFDNFFNTLPMAVIEINQATKVIRFARTNQSYRDFMARNFAMHTNDRSESFEGYPEVENSPFMKGLIQTLNDSEIKYVDETTPDNSVIHSCLRRIAINPKNGTVATAVAVLAVTNASQGTTYANIARALAADYSHLYYVNLEDNSFIEYSSEIGGEELVVERHGEDFFNESRKDALEYIYSEDQETFLDSFSKDKLLSEMDEHGLFTLNYRLLVNGEPVYVVMKAMRMQYDPNHIIIGVGNVDAQMKQKMRLEAIERNEMIYSRIMALSGDYICMYVVDKDTDEYYEYSSADAYKGLGLAVDGKDFFKNAQQYSETTIYPEDQELFRERFVRENVLNEINEHKLFTLNYRLMIEGDPVLVCVRAALVREDGADKLIMGVCKVDAAAQILSK